MAVPYHPVTMHLLVKSAATSLLLLLLLLPPQSAEEHWNFWYKYLTKHCFHGPHGRCGGPPACTQGYRFRENKGLISGGCAG